MTKVKHGLLVVTGVVALYACHIAGVASMPGQNQTFFLDCIYASQLYLFAAVVFGYFLGTIKAQLKKLFILFAVSIIISLVGFGFAGTASMEGPNQLGFLGQFFGIDAILVIASFGAYFLGTRRVSSTPTVAK
jgi:hypothetical protein